MSKKYEFKPDKPQITLLNKLYITATQRKIILKWFLYAMVLLVLSVLQDVILCQFRLFGATTDLVPCAIILICVMEGAEGGCLFSLIASALFLFSGTAPGVYSIVFITGISIVAAVFRQAYLQSGFGSAMLCSGISVLVYEMLIFVVGLFLGHTYSGRAVAFLLTGGLSLLVLPLLYPILLSIGRIGGSAWKE